MNANKQHTQCGNAVEREGVRGYDTAGDLTPTAYFGAVYYNWLG